MTFNVQYPWQLLVSSLVCGVAFGALYDVFRLFRAFTKNGKALLFFHDVVFCLLFSAAMCVLFFNYSGGRTRAYALLAACGGFAAYRLTLGKLAARLISRFRAAVIKLKTALVRALKRRAVSLRRAAFSHAEYRRQLNGAAKGYGAFKTKRR